MGETTLNRVHPERDEHLAAYYAQLTATTTTNDQQQTQLPHLAPSISKIEPAKAPHPQPSLHATSGKGKEAFDPVVVVPPPRTEHIATATRMNTATRHSWHLLTKAAMLIGAINPKDRNVIDIYHAPKVGNSRFMVHPNSKLRRLWDIVTASLVLYVIVVIPMVVGFGYVDWSGLANFNTFIDVYFIIDMVMTIRTGFFANGEVIMDRKAILHHYLRTWFIVDLISNFPLSLFVHNTARKSIKIVKLQKLPKLLRVGRLLKYLREYAKYYNLALSFVALAMGLHLFACLWANLFSECYTLDGDPVCEADELPRMYIQSVHNVVLMFTGIAESTTYAPIAHLLNPRVSSNIEVYIVSIVIFLFGMIFSSFLFGNILSLLMSWDQQSAMFRNRMDIISAEMRHYELPEELQHRVRRNYDYLWINQRAYSDMMLLNQPGISKTLRTTIALHLYKDLVKTVPFFAGSDQRFLGKVCLALETAVYLPGDTIIYCDDIGKEMFIVRKGLVEILIPEPGNPEKRIYLRDGNFFGETALVIDVRRTNTVKAVSICDLNVLNKSAFNEIVAEYPEFGERMKRTVIKRQLDNMNIQSPAEKMKVQNQLNLVVEKSLKQRRMSVSLKTIYRAKKLGDKLKEIADRAAARAVVTTSGSGRRLSRMINPRGATPPIRKIRPDGSPVDNNNNSSITSNNNEVPPHLHRPPLVPSGPAHLHPHLEPIAGSTHSTNYQQPVTTYPGFANSHHPAHLTTGNTPVTSSSQFNINGAAPSLYTQDSSLSLNGVNGPNGISKLRLAQMDSVSRKLNKAELTVDLIPSALKEITAMVNQIKRTTDRLNKRIHQTSDDASSDDDDFDLDDFESQINVGVESCSDEQQLQQRGSGGFDGSLPPITPLNEEYEEEIARRESNSVYTPRNRSMESGKIENPVETTATAAESTPAARKPSS